MLQLLAATQFTVTPLAVLSIFEDDVRALFPRLFQFVCV
jgi:hypothetical protein